MDWLKRNKALAGLVGWAVVGATNWATQGCAPVYDKDILAMLHVSCGTVMFGLSLAATFLVGAGVMTSDKHTAVQQGVRAPEGPPAIPPLAQVEREEKEEAKDAPYRS